MELGGAVALVTGASSGIGRAIALHLAANGSTVAGVARRGDLLASLEAECRAVGAEVLGLTADVADRSQAEAAVRAVEERFDRIDVIVNNAGVGLHRPAVQTTVEDIERVVSVNLLGAVYVTMAALPGMLDRSSGAILNVTSVAGTLPNPHESAYGATKAALALWSHGLAVDLHGTGVRVQELAPGPIDTDIWVPEALYRGRRYAPEVVARAAVAQLRSGAVHRTVPRHHGIPRVLYPAFGPVFRWGLRLFKDRATRRPSQFPSG